MPKQLPKNIYIKNRIAWRNYIQLKKKKSRKRKNRQRNRMLGDKRMTSETDYRDDRLLEDLSGRWEM